MSNFNYTYFSNATKYSLSIATLTLIGTLLRLPGLDFPITGDLASMFLKHFQTAWDLLLFNYRSADQKTLSILLAKLSMSILGDNEIALRLPALLVGIFALPLAYNVGAHTTSLRIGAIGTLILNFFFSKSL